MKSFVCLLLLFVVTCHAQNPLNILSLVRLQNSACQGERGDQGVCITSSECARREGLNMGTCASGLGVCCFLRFTCGGVTTQNNTLFVNPNYPNSENGTDTCQVTVEKQDNVCQLRLDFLEFTLAQPDFLGMCAWDSFMVRTTVGEHLPILCGENGGQHLYIDMGRGSGNPVVLSVVSNGDKVARKWKVKISMIQCNSLDMAPPGCVQYFRSPSETIRSFNFGPKLKGRVRYLSNLRYTACVRVEENFCSIKWELENPNSFSFGIPSEDGNSGEVCNDDDFIGIDQGSLDGFGPGNDRFCGERLLNKNVIISRSKPFMLKVKSNSDAVINSNYSQYGFSLKYTELPCMI
ncbi:uncharacterized protein LOC111635466 [Centruroides sculpturatus]|uniref:uncharacterized protein LOC111635466 n=1 Tax=Centruroides sculpturatus TaxID=218467 RepID=UPI000C6EF5A8|nr:uncharacterized protein LOC111635466 [Centruroides sculpturatus]XP_023236194.1 uncharacterized protein LOC111635466 [Centruroides sculpturatus]